MEKKEETFELAGICFKVYLTGKCARIVFAAFSSGKGQGKRENFVLVGKKFQKFHLTVEVSRKRIL